MLPQGWTIKKLGEVASSAKGKMPKSVADEKSSKHPIPYVNIKAFEKKVFEQFTDGEKCTLCETDDVLIVWDGARMGLVGRGIKGAVGSTLARIDSEVADKSYLFYFLRSKYKQINTNPRGVGIPHIEPKLFWGFDFPLAPLPEQKRIVAKIEELFSDLDKAVESLKKAQAQLKTYRQAVLKYAFEGRFTHKNIKPGELPEGWKWVRLGETGTLNRGISKNRPRDAKELYGGKYPFIQTGDVRKANGGTISEFSQTYSEKGFKQSKLWPKGTLCITIAANIADTGFLGFDSCFPDSVVGYIADDAIVNPRFVNYYLVRFKSNLEELAPATAQKNINVRILNQVNIPLAPLHEQNRTVNEIETRLSEADNLEKTIAASLEKAEATRQSILKKAFEGRLV